MAEPKVYITEPKVQLIFILMKLASILAFIPKLVFILVFILYYTIMNFTSRLLGKCSEISKTKNENLVLQSISYI
jgi:hypothetical protein